jgi:hypothetical protein
MNTRKRFDAVIQYEDRVEYRDEYWLVIDGKIASRRFYEGVCESGLTPLEVTTAINAALASVGSKALTFETLDWTEKINDAAQYFGCDERTALEKLLEERNAATINEVEKVTPEKVSEMELAVKIVFTDPIQDTEKVMQNVCDALKYQVEYGLGLVAEDEEEGCTQTVVAAFQGKEYLALNYRPTPKLLTDEEYLRLSRLFFGTTKPTARLFRFHPGTAELMKRADRYRDALQSLEYEEFCRTLSELTSTPQPFTVDGLTANWNVVYHYVNNPQQSSLLLVEILEAANAIVDLPITPEVIDSLDISEQAKVELVGKGLAIIWFKTQI